MSSRQNNGYPSQNADHQPDDDFDDFGVFEAADPAEAVGALGNQAVVSSWAAFASASATGRLQPDLLCAQNTFPRYLDPSGIPGIPQADGANGGGSDNLQASLPLFDAELGSGAQEHQRNEVEERLFGGSSIPIADVLDGTFPSPSSLSRAGGTGSFPASSMLPDIGLGTIQNCAFAEPSVANISQNARPCPHLPLSAGETEREEEAGHDQEDLLQGHAEEAVQDRNEIQAAAAAEFDGEVVPAAVDENQQSRPQSEIAILQSRNLILVQELERRQAEIDNHRLRQQELQQQHSEQLEAVRQSGHEALAVVVEQYKELSKTAVLEQQESSQRHLVQVMQQQQEAVQQVLQHQMQEGERERKEAMRGMEGELQAALESLRLQQQEKFDAFLTEERRKQEEVIRLAIEEERSRCRQQVEEAIAAEQAKTRQQLQQAKDDLVKQLEEMRQCYEQELKEARQEEREKAQTRLAACLEQERELTREFMSRALQEAQRDRDLFVEQQRQSDAAVRRRYLTSLDLLLESARRQIDLMLHSEKQSVPVVHQDEDSSLTK